MRYLGPAEFGLVGDRIKLQRADADRVHRRACLGHLDRTLLAALPSSCRALGKLPALFADSRDLVHGQVSSRIQLSLQAEATRGNAPNAARHAAAGGGAQREGVDERRGGSSGTWGSMTLRCGE